MAEEQDKTEFVRLGAVTRRKKTGHFRLRSVIAGLGGTILIALAISYLGAATDLAPRTDHISAHPTEKQSVANRQMSGPQIAESKAAELMQPMPSMVFEYAPEARQYSRFIPHEALAGPNFPGIDPIITGPVPGKMPTIQPEKRIDTIHMKL